MGETVRSLGRRVQVGEASMRKAALKVWNPRHRVGTDHVIVVLCFHSKFIVWLSIMI